jgi:hypothetical protein
MSSAETEPATAPAPVEALAKLAARLQARLRGRVRDFRLESQAGGVVLRGQSRTYYAKQIAQQEVMAAAGLRILANRIEVC